MGAEMIPIGRLQVATPRTMAKAIREATEAQKAVDDRVAGPAREAAVDALAADPRLVDEAVDKAMTGQGLVTYQGGQDQAVGLAAATTNYFGSTFGAKFGGRATPISLALSVAALTVEGKLTRPQLPADVPVLVDGKIPVSQLPPSSVPPVTSEQPPRLTDFGAVRGENISAAWAAAMAYMAGRGGTLIVPAGVWLTGSQLADVPGGVTVEGEGTTYSAQTGSSPALSSVIRATSVMAKMVRLGADPTSSDEGKPAAGIRGLILDGMGLADIVVEPDCRRWMIDHCQIYRGASIGVNVLGQNGRLGGRSVVSQAGVGSCVVIRHEPDNKITEADIREPGPDGACILIKPMGSSSLGTGNVLLHELHMWTGQNGLPTVGPLIKAELNGSKVLQGLLINACMLEGTLSDQIVFQVADTARVVNVAITGNTIFQNSTIPDNALAFLSMQGTGTISDMVISGNQFYGYSTSRKWKSLIHDVDGSDLTRLRILVGMNEARRVVTPWTRGASSTWSYPTAGGLNVGIGADGTAWNTAPVGSVSWVGDGVRTVFDHTPGDIPASARSIGVTPLSLAAAGPHFAEVSGGTLRTTFLTPPADGATVSISYQIAQ